jgi:glycerol-3-phosphate acyltransferase PlsY
MAVKAWMLLVGAYLLGSIPSAYLIARLVAGVDITQVGDGNVGAKNTYQSVGWPAGLAVGLADVAKGAASVGMARHLNMPDGIVYLVGACAVAGHDFSLYLGLRGGQGMATMVGVFGVLFLWEMATALGVLAIAWMATRNWDLSCFVWFVVFAGLVWLAGQPVLYPALLLPSIGLKKLLQAQRTRRRERQHTARKRES